MVTGNTHCDDRVLKTRRENNKWLFPFLHPSLVLVVEAKQAPKLVVRPKWRRPLPSCPSCSAPTGAGSTHPNAYNYSQMNEVNDEGLKGNLFSKSCAVL